MSVRTALLPTLVALIFIPMFVALGYWQLQRAEEKRVLQAEYDRRATETPVRIGPQRYAAEALQFRRIEATGRYQPEYQILLDNRVHRGVAGYHVITPLRIEGGETRVLVNRGWIPLGPDRQHIPVLDTPSARVHVVGVATVPHEPPLALGSPEPVGEVWQPVWQHLDLDRYARAAPFTVQPVVMLLDPENRSGGFVREWSRLDPGIAVHKGYAFQWFALAAATLAVYLVLMRQSMKRNRRRSHDR